MKDNDHIIADEHILRQLGPHKLKILRRKGHQLDAAIEAKEYELEKLTMNGHSSDHRIEVTINAQHRVLDVKIHDIEKNDPILGEDIMQAINDAIFKIELVKETALDTVEYEWTMATIKEIEH